MKTFSSLRCVTGFLFISLPIWLAVCTFNVLESDTVGADKIITIDRDSYQEGYPAVWFSPADGEIEPVISDTSQNPPEFKFFFWVEPGVPKFEAYILDPDTNGLKNVGHGTDVFTSKPHLDSGGYVLDMFSMDTLAAVLLDTNEVYFIRIPGGGCLIQVSEWNQAEQYLKFKWRKWEPDSTAPFKTITVEGDGSGIYTWFSPENGDTAYGGSSSPDKAVYEFRIDPGIPEFIAPDYDGTSDYGIKYIGAGEEAFELADSVIAGDYQSFIAEEQFQLGFVFMIHTLKADCAIYITEFDKSRALLGFYWKGI
ncbi:hypothetical protein ACFL5V_09510 [Fibrobacterota bacterium]